MRLIDRDKIPFNDEDCYLDYFALKYAIDNMPTIDAAPVVRGLWHRKYTGEEKFTNLYLECSECGFNGIGAGSNYCPHCGAKMSVED